MPSMQRHTQNGRRVAYNSDFTTGMEGLGNPFDRVSYNTKWYNKKIWKINRQNNMQEQFTGGQNPLLIVIIEGAYVQGASIKKYFHHRV